MFFVFNKEKIYSYIIALSTVIVLFGISVIVGNNEKTVQVSSNIDSKLPIYSVSTEENKIAFTMNCAWNADDIDSILETLDKCNTKITFFMVGDWVKKYPQEVKKIYEHGHEIGNHSDTHPHVNKLSLEKNKEEIEECNKKVKELIGQEVNLYRCPYGEYNNTVIESANMKSMKTIQWSLDTLDYTGLTGKQMWERLEKNIKKGSIVLSHNGTKHAADSLEMLINNIKDKGFTVVKVSELIYNDNYDIDGNGMQIKEKNT